MDRACILCVSLGQLIYGSINIWVTSTCININGANNDKQNNKKFDTESFMAKKKCVLN